MKQLKAMKNVQSKEIGVKQDEKKKRNKEHVYLELVQQDIFKIGRQVEDKGNEKKVIDVQYIPSINQITEYEIQCIVGEIYVVFDFDNRQFNKYRSSCLNNFKRIENTMIHKQSRFLEVNLEQKSPSIKQFENISRKLQEYPNKAVHVFGILLEKYQELCNRIFEAINNCNNLNVMDNLSSQKNNLDILKSEYLNSFNQEEFVFTMEQIINSNTYEFEVNSICISEPFLILMGTSLDQYQRYMHRFGLNDFMDSTSTLQLHTCLLNNILHSYGIGIDEQLSREINKKEQIDVTLHTFDGLLLPAKLSFKTIIPSSTLSNTMNEIASQVCILMEYKFEIEAGMLQQLIQMRYNQSAIKDQAYSNDIDFSLEYAIQSDLFHDMAKLHRIYSNTHQTASYRHLNRYQNVDNSSYNLQSTIIYN